MKNNLSDASMISISEIKENPKNRNKHPEDQIDRLAKILQDQGWRHPLIVSKRSGLLVVGHGRLAAAKKLGMTEVPVTMQDFSSEEEEFRFGVADNAIASWSELDLSGIHLDLPTLESFDIDLLGIKEFQFEPDNFNDEEPKSSNTCPNCGIAL